MLKRCVSVSEDPADQADHSVQTELINWQLSADLSLTLLTEEDVPSVLKIQPTLEYHSRQDARDSATSWACYCNAW